jgi:hypothetical protein
MPTREVEPRFLADYGRLTLEQRRRFRAAVRELVEDLKAGRQPRPGLRVHRVEIHPGVWSLIWAPDGRATFSYGEVVRPSEPHIIWRRIGGHAIYDNP